MYYGEGRLPRQDSDSSPEGSAGGSAARNGLLNSNAFH